MVKNRLILSGLFLLCAAFAGAQEAPAPFTAEQVQELLPLKQSVLTVQELSESAFLDPAVRDHATDRYLALAAKVAGRPVTMAELLSVKAEPVRLTAAQKFVGFITWVNILWMGAILIGVVSFCYLFGDLVKVLLEMLVEVPLAFYELVFYGLSLGLIAYANHFRPSVAAYVALTGCLLFAGAMGFTISRRRLTKNVGLVYFSVLAALYSGVALLYTSPMVGFFAVIALMGALGFSVLVGPLCVCIGFHDEDSLGKATVAALAMLVAFVVISITGSPALTVFKAGALWMGSFVGFLGLLIASSRWYRRQFPYVVMQFVTVAAGMAALFVGSVWHISELQRIGGTFFSLYLLEKLGEIPVESRRGYAFLGLTCSGFIYWFCMTVKSNPEAWRPYLLF